jgi:hypothetical protein
MAAVAFFFDRVLGSDNGLKQAVLLRVAGDVIRGRDRDVPADL